MNHIVMAATAALCVALTSCAAPDEPDDDDAGPSPQPATGSAFASPAPTTGPPSPTTQPQDVSASRFGKAFTYPGGLTVRVGAPQRFKPSPWLDRLDGTPMRFPVTIRNRTDDEFNPSQLHVTLRSSFAQAVQIFDYENGVVARPEDRLQPGRTARFAVGYWVTDREDMVMELAPGFAYESSVIGE